MTSAPVHEWLVAHEDRHQTPPTQLIELRAYMDSLPETRTTFHLGDAIDATAGNGGSVLRHLITMTGAWEVPSLYPNGSDTKNVVLVHPDRTDAPRYSDVYRRCACGGLFTHPQPQSTHTDPAVRGANRHSQQCPTYARYEMRARLLRKRDHVIRQSLTHGVTGIQLSRRLSFTSNRVGRVAEQLCINRDAISREYYDRRARTFAELARLGYSRAEIAAVYGVAPSTVTEELAKRLDTKMREVRDESPRYANDYSNSVKAEDESP